MVLATVLLAVFSELRYLAMLAGTWDLGIYQQALWSGSHGGPFYEAADWETGGFGTFLQVHSAFILYAIAPLYRAWPDPLTLFVVQAAVVAAAAYPLYYLALSRGATPRRALGLAGLYLAWGPAVDGVLYDFHIEAFLPLLYLTVAYLWSTGRFRTGAVAVGIGFLTMEAMPVLLVFLGLFLGWERFQELRGHEPPDRWASILRDRRLWAAAGLVVACVVAYYFLLDLRTSGLAAWFGFPAYPTAPAGYIIGGTPSQLHLTLASVFVDFAGKIEYWALLLALCAGLPLLRPRSLLLPLPWFAFTLLITDPNYTTLGFQYALVAGGPLFVGAAWGLPSLPLPSRPVVAARPRGTRLRSWMVRRGPSLGTCALGTLVVANLALTPFLGLAHTSDGGLAYHLGQDLPPASEPAMRLAALIPANAPVIASDFLFPYVANDLHAYSLLYAADPNLTLPFNASHLPPYVLIAGDRLYSVPPWLVATLYVPGDFGVRGVAWNTPAGTAVLFQRNYSGPLAQFGPQPAPGRTLDPSSLSSPANEAAVRTDPASPTGSAMITVPEAVGLLWDGPYADLGPGNYTATFWLRAYANLVPAPAATTSVLTVVSGEFGQANWFVHTFTFGALDASTYVPMTIDFNVTAPSLSVTFPGYAITPSVGISLAEIVIAPA